MKPEAYINLIKDRTQAYFKLEEKKTILDREYDLVASYQMLLGRTFVSQKTVIDQFETNEYILVKTMPRLGQDELDTFCKQIPEIVEDLVKLNQNHRSTYINFILAADALEVDKKTIERFKHEKIYAFYFRGFSDVRLIVVNLDKDEIICNKSAKAVKKAYKPF